MKALEIKGRGGEVAVIILVTSCITNSYAPPSHAHTQKQELPLLLNLVPCSLAVLFLLVLKISIKRKILES